MVNKKNTPFRSSAVSSTEDEENVMNNSTTTAFIAHSFFD